jgi:hypothetical protein
MCVCACDEHTCTHTPSLGNFKNYVLAEWRRKTCVMGVGGFAQHQTVKKK